MDNIIYGKNSIIEALNNNVTIERLYILKGNKDKVINNIFNKCKDLNIIIDTSSKDYLDKLSENGNHQGIVGKISDFKYSTIDDILNYAIEKNVDDFIIMLDHIEDPHNLGAIIRSAVCAGCTGIIIPDRRGALVNSTVIKTSSGMAFAIPVVKVTNLSKEIEKLKEKGIWFIASHMNGENMYNQNLKGKVCLIMGNEGKGVSDNILKKADFITSIPMEENSESLNVSVATGVLIYEIKRQRSC